MLYKLSGKTVWTGISSCGGGRCDNILPISMWEYMEL